MRRLAAAICAGVLLMGCGDAGDGGGARIVPEKPKLSIVLDGASGYLAGIVLVRAEVSPEGAFQDVDFRAAGESFGVDSDPPFEAPLFSKGLPDGPTELSAVGRLVDSTETIVATRAAEVANDLPHLSLISPKDGDVIAGSAAQDLVVAPVIEASDGNGIAKIYVETNVGPVDIGAGDGLVEVPLMDMAGPDFPASPVDVKVRAVDGSGMERLAKVSVVPSVTP